MPLISRIVLGCVLLTLVAVLSERSRTAAGILATAPINIPIILWILWGSSHGDHQSLQTVSRSMLIGLFSTACFTVICWLGFRQRWSFVQIMAAGYGAWALVVLAPALVRRMIERLG